MANVILLWSDIPLLKKIVKVIKLFLFKKKCIKGLFWDILYDNYNLLL